MLYMRAIQVIEDFVKKFEHYLVVIPSRYQVFKDFETFSLF